MSILDDIISYKNSPNELKDRAISYITDGSIPLMDRWETFKEMPNDWHIHENWLQHFDSEKLLVNSEISWYDDVYVERYETVDMIELVDDRLCDRLSEDPNVYENPETILNAFREEIMAKNLGSFVFDW